MSKTKEPKIEAYGWRWKRSDRVQWRRTFTDAEALHKWAEKNDAVVMGVREQEVSK